MNQKIHYYFYNDLLIIIIIIIYIINSIVIITCILCLSIHKGNPSGQCRSFLYRILIFIYTNLRMVTEADLTEKRQRERESLVEQFT